MEEWVNNLLNLLKNAKNFKLVSITENKKINKKIFGLKPQLNSKNAFKNANVIIDFTVPKCTLEVTKNCFKIKKKSSYWNNRFFKKRRKFNKKIF